MNGPTPEGDGRNALSEPERMIARTAQDSPPGDDSPEATVFESSATSEVTAPAVEHGLDPSGDELAQLEALLEARARELAEQRAEVARLRGLLRDAIERFDASVSAAAEQVARSLRSERDQAVARALEAEAARAEIGFKLDEVMGHLAAAGAAEGALPGERIDVTCARLAGTVRGLVAALAEAQESRETAQARLLLTEQDVLELRAEVRGLERERAELREQLELEQLKARRLTEHWQGGLDAATASALRGERDGLRARNAESERAFAAVGARVAELEQVVAREIEERGKAGAALAQAQAERMVLLDELARARAPQAEPRLSQYADALRDVRAELSELGAALRRAEQRGKGLAGVGGAPESGEDAAGTTTLIEPAPGVELQLAASEERVRALEARLASAAATVAGLEARAGSPAAAQQLAALRALLEQR